MARCLTILDKYFDHDAKSSLLAELKRWTLCMDCADFWKEQAWEKMISDAHASCTVLVDQIIIEETPYLSAETNLTSDIAPISNINTVQLDINKDKIIRSDQNNVSYKNSANVDQHDNTNPNDKTNPLEGEEKRKFREPMDTESINVILLHPYENQIAQYHSPSVTIHYELVHNIYIPGHPLIKSSIVHIDSFY